MLLISVISGNLFRKGNMGLIYPLSTQAPAYFQPLSTRLSTHSWLETLFQLEQRRIFIRPFVFLT
jgi:hypothetical protein